MTAIEVDEATRRALELAARMAGCTPGEIVKRLVNQASMPRPQAKSAETESAGAGVPVYADYAGHRTRATFDPITSRIDITGGPLVGTSYKSPSGAAGAVIAHYKPEVNTNRDGWAFWRLDDGTNRRLISIRGT